MTNDAKLEAYRGRRALVTGGLGFIGSNLVRALHGLGCKVTVLDNLTPELGGNPFNLDGIEGEVEAWNGDVRDEAAVAQSVRGCDAVFHLAGLNSHLDSLEDPWDDFDVNTRGTLIMLEAIRKHAPRATFVYAGSRSEYGLIQTTPVSETHPLLPTEPNSANKAAASLQTIAYHQAHELRTVVLRLTNIYGPRMRIREHKGMGFMNWFVRFAIQDGAFHLYGDGSQLRDMVYVDDAVNAFLLAAITPQAAGEALNVGSGAPSSLMTIARELVAISGRGSIESMPFPEEAARIEIGDYVADTKKIEKLLGWKAAVGLRQGLEQTVSFYQTHGGQYL